MRAAMTTADPTKPYRYGWPKWKAGPIGTGFKTHLCSKHNWYPGS